MFVPIYIQFLNYPREVGLSWKQNMDVYILYLYLYWCSQIDATSCQTSKASLIMSQNYILCSIWDPISCISKQHFVWYRNWGHMMSKLYMSSSIHWEAPPGIQVQRLKSVLIPWHSFTSQYHLSITSCDSQAELSHSTIMKRKGRTNIHLGLNSEDWCVFHQLIFYRKIYYVLRQLILSTTYTHNWQRIIA